MAGRLRDALGLAARQAVAVRIRISWARRASRSSFEPDHEAVLPPSQPSRTSSGGANRGTDFVVYGGLIRDALLFLGICWHLDDYRRLLLGGGDVGRYGVSDVGKLTRDSVNLLL